MLGIDIIEPTSIKFRVLLQDVSGSFISGSTTSLSIHRLEANGTLVGFDFSNNTFNATPSVPTASMTHQQVDSVDTGIWTYVLSNVSSFSEGSIYIASTYNSTAAPLYQVREFQYGDGILLPQEYDTNMNLLNSLLSSVGLNVTEFGDRLTDGVLDRTLFLDNLDVSGILANRDDADLYKASLTAVIEKISKIGDIVVFYAECFGAAIESGVLAINAAQKIPDYLINILTKSMPVYNIVAGQDNKGYDPLKSKNVLLSASRDLLKDLEMYAYSSLSYVSSFRGLYDYVRKKHNQTIDEYLTQRGLRVHSTFAAVSNTLGQPISENNIKQQEPIIPN